MTARPGSSFASRPRRLVPPGVVAWLVLALLLTPLVLPAEVSAAPPSGFGEEELADVAAPTDLAFLPDGRLLIASQPGQLFVLPAGTTEKTDPDLALDLSAQICGNGERGLLGVAVDPGFDADAPGEDFVYLYYTARRSGGCPTSRTELKPAPDRDDLRRCERIENRQRKRRCLRTARDGGGDYAPARTLPVNRVVRYEMTGDTVGPAADKMLLDNIPSLAGNHNGGDLGFGDDGLLYVSVGDSGCQLATRVARCQGANVNAQSPNLLNGKLLRITGDGGIPEDDPYQGQGTVSCAASGRASPGQRCREIFASGLRNPFRFAFDPNVGGTRFFINDVGGAASEEIDEGERGANYGWPSCEGRYVQGSRNPNQTCDNNDFKDPVYDYQHNPEGGSITGGAFVPDDAPGRWQDYKGDYLFGDYVYGEIFRLGPGGSDKAVPESFASGVGPVSSLAFDPEGEALYYGSYAGKVFRVAPE